MERLLVIDSITGTVINVIVPWKPPEGCYTAEHPHAQIGWVLDKATGDLQPPD